MSEYQTNQVLHNNYNNKYINNISAKNISNIREAKIEMLARISLLSTTNNQQHVCI